MHDPHPAAGRPPRRGEALPSLKSTRLLDQLRERIRALHYSLRTEEAYVLCVLVLRFHGVRSPLGYAADRRHLGRGAQPRWGVGRNPGGARGASPGSKHMTPGPRPVGAGPHPQI